MTRFRFQVSGFRFHISHFTYHLLRLTPHPFLLTFLVFISALLPRLYALDAFLTIDEVKWAEGAAQFLLALCSGDLFQTYWHFHPGITITWGSALALWARCASAPDLAVCANSAVENLADTIAWLRLSPVLLTSLGVAGVYVLGRKLVGERMALLAALLLAFDPFFLAHSRILNGDASAAILMFLSLLAFVRYWLGESANSQSANQRINEAANQQAGVSPAPLLPRPPASSPLHPSLILSGVLAGLALLTKLPSPLIAIFVGGLGFVAIIRDFLLLPKTETSVQSQTCPEPYPERGRRGSRRIQNPKPVLSQVEGCKIFSVLRYWLFSLTVWGGVAWLVFVALWPAMWVSPLQALRLMYLDAFAVGGAGEGHDTFFFGQTVSDPGPWFYPYAIAFRLTPIISVGLVIAIGWLLSRVMCHVSRVTCHVSRITCHAPRNLQSPISNIQSIIGWILLAFIVFVILFSNLSPKKLDRYVMVVIPALIFLAASGFTEITAYGVVRTPSILRITAPCPERSRRDGPRLTQDARKARGVQYAIVALQLLFALPSAPYYLTYYNPLLGGVNRAVTQLPVGWGEGLEQAAYYLNGLPDAGSLSVSSWYGDIFQPYFVGRQAGFADDGRAQLAADYVVFYVNQVQRQKPYPGLVNYFRTGEPVFAVAVESLGQVVNLIGSPQNGNPAHWVEVYKAPAAQSAGGAPKVEGVAQLLAYKVAGDRAADTGLRVGEDVPATLFFRVLGPLPEGTTFRVALVPVTSTPKPVLSRSKDPKSAKGAQSEIQNRMWGSWRRTEVKGEWLDGNIVEWNGVLGLPGDMPPGAYRLWLAFQFDHEAVIAEFPISPGDPEIRVKE